MILNDTPWETSLSDNICRGEAHQGEGKGGSQRHMGVRQK